MNNVNLCCTQTSSTNVLSTKCLGTNRPWSCLCAHATTGHILAPLAESGCGDGSMHVPRLSTCWMEVHSGGCLCPGSECCDWRPTCRLQRTQCLSDPRHPCPAVQSAASVFIHCHIKSTIFT